MAKQENERLIFNEILKVIGVMLSFWTEANLSNLMKIKRIFKMESCSCRQSPIERLDGVKGSSPLQLR